MTQAPEYRLVPVEPTEAMIEAGKGERIKCFADTLMRADEAVRRIFIAMTAAAPHTAAPAADRAVSERPLYLWEHDSLTSRVASVEDAKSFTDGNPRWVRAYPVELFTAPPADRAELAKRGRTQLLVALSRTYSAAIAVCSNDEATRRDALAHQDLANAAEQELGTILNALARSTDAPSEPVAPPMFREPLPDDLLTVANIESDGNTLTLEINQLGDLVHLIGEDERTFTLTIAPMRRADFDDLGDFNGF